jgi:hypothetical protein
MPIHRIITTTLGSLEEETMVSAAREVPSPPITVITTEGGQAIDAGSSLVEEMPPTSADPLGSIKWDFGGHRLILSKEHTEPLLQRSRLLTTDTTEASASFAPMEHG